MSGQKSTYTLRTLHILTIGWLLSLPAVGALPPTPSSDSLDLVPEVILTYAGPGIGQWFSDGSGQLPSGTYPAAGEAVVSVVYNCDGVAGRECGNFVFADGLGAATCEWTSQGSNDGGVVSLLLGSSDGPCQVNLITGIGACRVTALVSSDVQLHMSLSVGACSVTVQD